MLGSLLTGSYLASLRDVGGRSAAATVLVAVEGARVAGAVTYVSGPGAWSEFDDPDVGAIRMLAVAPWAQGRGVGRALVEACLERARADGRLRVALHTVSVMTGAQHLYERIGFQRATGHDWTLPSGMVLIAYEIGVGPPT